MRRRLGVLVVLLVALSGCGDDGGGPSDAGTDATGRVAVDPDASPEERIEVMADAVREAGVEVECVPADATEVDDPRPVAKLLCSGAVDVTSSFFAYGSHEAAEEAADGLVRCDLGGVQVFDAEGNPQSVPVNVIVLGDIAVVVGEAVVDEVHETLGGDLSEATC